MRNSDGKNEKKRESIAVHDDLRRLQNNERFKEAVLKAKGDVMATQELCYDFLIGDTDWIQHVIRHWDGEGPLPRTDSDEIYRSPIFRKPSNGASFNPIILGYYDGNFFARLEGFYGGTDTYFDGSPMLRRQSLFQRNKSGDTWVTLRIRLTNDLPQDEVNTWIHDQIFKARKARRPNSNDLVLSMLDEFFPRGRKLTVYSVSQYITEDLKPKLDQRGLSVSMSTAKIIAREWLK